MYEGNFLTRVHASRQAKTIPLVRLIQGLFMADFDKECKKYRCDEKGDIYSFHSQERELCQSIPSS